MSIWTLNYNGTEQDLSTWGIRVDFSVELVSKGKCVLRMTTTENFDAATPQFAWKEPVTLWQNRTAVGSGGTVYFKGFVGKITRVAEGANQGIAYEFYDVWWLLERQTFKQARNNITAVDPTTHDFTYGNPIFSSEIYLGELVSLTGNLVALVPNGAGISEILSWLNECFNATRRGSQYGLGGSVTEADDVVNFWGRGSGQWPPSGTGPSFGLPATAVDSGNGNAVMDPQAIIPSTRVQSLSCAEAIVQMLRWSPSVTVQRDFTTSPPTLHFRDQLGTNALSTVTITLTDVQARQIEASADYERQLPAVIIHYKTTSVVNGVPIYGLTVDYWPASGTIDGTAISAGTIDFIPYALTLFVELSGGNVTYTEATLQCAAIANATSGTLSVQEAFWSEYEPLLKNNPNISAITFDSSTFTLQQPGSTTAVSSSTYPYVLLPKSPFPHWLGTQGYVVTDAVMSIQVSFTQANKAGLQTHQVTRYIHARVKVTSAPAATYVGRSASGTIDPIPTLGAGGLANQIYNGLSTLSYSGRITLLETQLATGDLTGIVPGAPLELNGPTNTYSNLFVQSVRARPHFGELEITYGPASRLDAKDLIELWRCTRERRIYDMPSGRGTGTADASNASLDQTGDSPVENNSAPPGDNTYHAVTSPS